MGKIRAVDTKSPKYVQLRITGPKAIISQPMIITVPVNRTWHDVLIEDLGLQVPGDKDIFVCSNNFSQKSSGNESAFSAELNEQVNDFIQNFQRRKQKYRVRICRRRQAGNARSSKPSNLRGRPQKRSRVPIRGHTQSKTALKHAEVARNNSTGNGMTEKEKSNAKPYLRPRFKTQMKMTRLQNAPPNVTPKMSRVSHTRVPQIVSVFSLSSQVQETTQQNFARFPAAKEDIENGSVDVNDSYLEGEDGRVHEERDLIASSADSARDEETEDEKNIKPFATQRFSCFSNTLLQKAKDEIDKLKENNLLDENMVAAPFSFYLLQDILK